MSKFIIRFFLPLITFPSIVLIKFGLKVSGSMASGFESGGFPVTLQCLNLKGLVRIIGTSALSPIFPKEFIYYPVKSTMSCLPVYPILSDPVVNMFLSPYYEYQEYCLGVKSRLSG
jgi:hypothetical protein